MVVMTKAAIFQLQPEDVFIFTVNEQEESTTFQVLLERQGKIRCIYLCQSAEELDALQAQLFACIEEGRNAISLEALVNG